jgi:hypothetical protein
MTPLKEKLRRYCIQQFGYEKYRISGNSSYTWSKKKRCSIDRYTWSGSFSHSVKYDLSYEQLELLINKFINENKQDFIGI